MKFWTIVYPVDEHLNYKIDAYSEEDIITEYWTYWWGRMIEIGKVDLITKENCIDDWVVVNWANEITEEEYNNIKEKNNV